MRIKEIYTPNDNFGPLTIVKDNSFSQIEKFLTTKDPRCSQNYYRNKAGLKIYIVDKMNFEQVSAAYTPNGNSIVMPLDNKNLTHELMHMASSFIDGPKVRMFKNSLSWSDELAAIEEGLAEFLASIIDNKPIDTYGIQSFVAKMLYTTTNEEILIPFFEADGPGFVEMFKEIDIVNVLLNLSVFHYHEVFGTAVDTLFDEKGYAECFYDMLESLIDIELAYNRTLKQVKSYRDIFLSSLEEEIIKYEVEDFDEDYHNKVKKLIDSKIRRRG